MVFSVTVVLLATGVVILCLSASATLYGLLHRRSSLSQAYILTNRVTHLRLLPAESTHSFSYPTLSLLLSLNALENKSLDLARGWIFGYGGTWGRLTSLRPNRYLIDQGSGSRSIKDKLIQVLKERGYDGDLLEDAWMMTMPAFLGWEGINPLTVYFCYKPGDEFWITVLEVHNTFGEGHVYIMQIGRKEDKEQPIGYDHQWTIPRAFHVSPFNDRSGFYRISVKAPSHSPTIPDPDEYLAPPRPAVRIHLHTASPETTELSQSELQVPGPLKLMALLRPTVATPLTISFLLSALCRVPFALLLTFPRILYQAKILHYKKRLDVFIRPEPRTVVSGRQSVAEVDIGKKIEGGIKWQDEGLFQGYARRRVEEFLSHRVDETGIAVSLISSNPSVARRTFTPASKSKLPKTNCDLPNDSNSNAHLTIQYLSPRFFIIVLQSPSAGHAHLLGSTTERIFTASSVDLFLIIFSGTSYPRQPSSPSSLVSFLSIQQRIRSRPVPLPLLTSPSLPVPSAHPLDSTSVYGQLMSIFIVCCLLFLDNLEKWVFNIVHARVVPGDEPWKQWERAELLLAEDRIRRKGYATWN